MIFGYNQIVATIRFTWRLITLLLEERHENVSLSCGLVRKFIKLVIIKYLSLQNPQNVMYSISGAEVLKM